MAKVPDKDQILRSILAFLQADSEEEAQRIVEENPDLLSDEADVLMNLLVVYAREKNDAKGEGLFKQRLELLRRCREVGLKEAFSKKTRGNSSDLISILQELSQPATIDDMPRRVLLCQQALSLVSREQNATLWAALKVELGNSLARSPRGDRADNIEKAIEAYGLALEVMTRDAMPIEWARTMMKWGSPTATEFVATVPIISRRRSRPTGKPWRFIVLICCQMNVAELLDTWETFFSMSVAGQNPSNPIDSLLRQLRT